MAISRRQPRSWPWMAATTGLAKRSMRRSTLLPKRMNASTVPPEKAEPRSAPAQKIRSPAPVRMTARTASSASTVTSTSCSSCMRRSLIALAGGRFRVITAKPSSRARIRVSNAMDAHSLEEDRRHRVGGIAEAVGALAQHPGRCHLVHGAEEYLRRDLHWHVGADLAGGDALLEDRADQLEGGGDLVGRGATEELVALAQLDLDDLGPRGLRLLDRKSTRLNSSH